MLGYSSNRLEVMMIRSVTLQAYIIVRMRRVFLILDMIDILTQISGQHQEFVNYFPALSIINIEAS